MRGHRWGSLTVVQGEDVVLAQAAWMKSRRSLRCDVVLDVLAVKAATCGAYNARGSAPT